MNVEAQTSLPYVLYIILVSAYLHVEMSIIYGSYHGASSIMDCGKTTIMQIITSALGVLGLAGIDGIIRNERLSLTFSGLMSPCMAYFVEVSTLCFGVGEVIRRRRLTLLMVIPLS